MGGLLSEDLSTLCGKMCETTFLNAEVKPGPSRASVLGDLNKATCLRPPRPQPPPCRGAKLKLPSRALLRCVFLLIHATWRRPAESVWVRRRDAKSLFPLFRLLFFFFFFCSLYKSRAPSTIIQRHSAAVKKADKLEERCQTLANKCRTFCSEMTGSAPFLCAATQKSMPQTVSVCSR